MKFIWRTSNVFDSNIVQLSSVVLVNTVRSHSYYKREATGRRPHSIVYLEDEDSSKSDLIRYVALLD